MSKIGYTRAALILGAFVAAACSSDDVVPRGLAESCILNTDCSSPLVCAFQKCHVACNTSRDCTPRQRCVASDRPFHVCQLAEEQVCKLNSDCPEHQTCGVDLQCRDQCVGDRDCVDEQVCAGGTCAEPRELIDGELKSALADAGSASGHPCLYTSECASPLVCHDHLCSLECITSKDCPSAHDCVNNRCVAGSGSLIGPAGGVVSEASGKVTLTIAPNALAAPVSILILPVEAFPEGALGPVFELEPSGIRFAVPATLTYRYSMAEIGAAAPADLRIAVARQDTWTPLASNLDAAASTLSASLEHLSIYGIITPPKALTDASVTPADTGVDASPPDAGVADASLVHVQPDSGAPADAPVDVAVTPVDASVDAPGDVSVVIPAEASVDASIDAPDDVLGPIDAPVTDASNPCPVTTPTVVVANAGSLYGIAIDSTDVYWSSRTGSLSTILKAPLGGLPDASVPPVLASSLDIFEGIFVDPSGVYYSANSADNIWMAPLTGVPDGGAATSLAPGQSAQPRAVYGFGGDLYWVNTTYSGAPSIRAVPMKGGAVRIIASFPAGTGLLGQALFVDASGVYFAVGAAGNNGIIYRAPLTGIADGGVPSTVATGLASPGQVFGDGVDLYFTDGLAVGRVGRAPIDGLQAATTLATGISYPGGLWLDGSNVYFSAGLSPAARIIKVPKSGGVMTPLVCGQQGIFQIALSSTDIYFPGATSILSVPK